VTVDEMRREIAEIRARLPKLMEVDPEIAKDVSDVCEMAEMHVLLASAVNGRDQ
jgi:hypothetical protein